MRYAAVFFLLILLTACAGRRAYEEGIALLDGGSIEQGLASIEEAARLEPDNRQYRAALIRERDAVLARQLNLADAARQQGQYTAAAELYQRILQISPDNARAKASAVALAGERRQRALLTEAETLFKKGDEAGAAIKVRSVLAENGSNRDAQALMRRIEERSLRAAAAGPQLTAALRKPVTLEFRDAGIRQVFELLSRSTGLNFILDRDVRPDLRTTVFVKNSTVEDVLRFVLVTNQLDRRILSDNTVLIYPNTQTKQRDYQELVVKTFYLANTDAKTVGNMIKTMVKTKDMHIDEKLNIVVMRDTPAAVRLAERLIANQDLAEPEVMLEVEVMEVGSNVLYDIGMKYPDQVSWSLMGAAGTAGALTLPEWLNRNSSLVSLAFSNPLFALTFRNTVGRTNLLANPRIRVKNKDKAKVHIGDKVPVITTTSTSTGFVSESVAYLDVGLKLDVEPTVFLDNEVGIKIGLEVSNIAREIKSTSGTLAYQVGTRNASTVLRLKDGETQVLAGLISDEDRKTATQIPGLGSIPIVGRLFGSHQDTFNKSEIVLLITPHIVRNLARPELRFEEFPGGTEAATGAMPMFLESVPLTAPAGASAGAPGSAPPPGTAQQPAGRLLLQAPATVPAGGEFTMILSSEAEGMYRAGLVDFAFDPSRIRFISAQSEFEFRANAPDASGRLSLSFPGKTNFKGTGELAKLRFQVIGAAQSAPSIRIDAASLTDISGRVINAQLPPPVTLSLTR